MNHKRTGYIFITLLYMLMITYFSLRPGSQVYHGSIARQVVSNFLHIPAYGLLLYLILRSFLSTSSWAYIFSFVTSSLFGILNEYLQSFVPGRYPSVMDALLNVSGSFSALFIILIIKQPKTRNASAQRSGASPEGILNTQVRSEAEPPRRGYSIR